MLQANRISAWLVSSLAIVIGVETMALAVPPERYPAAKHGPASLQTIGGVAVLTVAGTPAEMGEQTGALGCKAMEPTIRSLMNQFQSKQGFRNAWPKLLIAARGMKDQYPLHHLEELEATAKASGLPRDWFFVGNVAGDMLKVGEMAQLGACSTFVVEPMRSATGGTLLGRNLDIPTIDPIPECTLVIVYRPTGKKAFASIGFPGLIGVASGMNESGVAITINEITSSADGSAKFDPEGTPMVLRIRKLLEECASVDEVEKLLKATPRTTMFCLTVADRKTSAIFEITTKHVGRRGAEHAVNTCTNHFRTSGLSNGGERNCWRYPKLEAARRGEAKLGLDDVTRALDSVNQGRNTVQHMIFEPETLKLHVALGNGPATQLPRKTVELAPLMKGP